MRIAKRVTAVLAALVAVGGGVGVAAPAATAATEITIRGTITLGDTGHAAGAGEARVGLVYVSPQASPTKVGVPVLTDASGHYALTTHGSKGIEEYVLHVEYLGSGGFLSVYGNRTQFVGLPGEGDWLPVELGEDIVFDQTLPRPTTITGRVVTTAGVAANGQLVATRSDVQQNYSHDLDQSPYVKTSSDGTYRITGLLPGRYSVSFEGSGAVWDGATWSFPPSATRPFPVDTRTGDVAVADQIAYALASVFGHFRCPSCDASAYEIVKSYLIRVEPDGGQTLLQSGGEFFGQNGDYGSYYFTVFPGTYRAAVTFPGVPEAGAILTSPVTLDEGQQQTWPDDLSNPTTARLAGSDRFDTSAVISANTLTPTSRFDPGLDTVFVASGLNFPDALSTVPVAASLSAPLLLVKGDEVPASVAGELSRLHPRRIVVVGGPAIISDSVLRRLRDFVGSPSDVVRVAGADRFATSRALTEFGFPHGTGTMLLASAWTFPDALSAGAAASAKRGGVLLVDGRLRSPDVETVTQLKRSSVTSVEIVGGPAAISPGFAEGLTAAGFSVTRVSGTDRFATSVAVTDDAFPGVRLAADGAIGALHLSETAVVASGLNFPDALAGAALAGKVGAPLLLAATGCVPPDALRAMQEIGAQQAIVIGGTATLSGAIDRLATCR
ncbi:hypothetical protein A0130_10885 [Leifsonia xyli]|uniref:cell wall-binding repeat-containing protein n=1 Tax=Leifsonia xyli TaxID=1575 RepID=UPI0007CDB505|nr:hypothetical protein A0130_10885 [Leifsonia xyli]